MKVLAHVCFHSRISTEFTNTTMLFVRRKPKHTSMGTKIALFFSCFVSFCILFYVVSVLKIKKQQQHNSNSNNNKSRSSKRDTQR